MPRVVAVDRRAGGWKQHATAFVQLHDQRSRWIKVHDLALVRLAFVLQSDVSAERQRVLDERGLDHIRFPAKRIREPLVQRSQQRAGDGFTIDGLA